MLICFNCWWLQWRWWAYRGNAGSLQDLSLCDKFIMENLKPKSSWCSAESQMVESCDCGDDRKRFTFVSFLYSLYPYFYILCNLSKVRLFLMHLSPSETQLDNKEYKEIICSFLSSFICWVFSLFKIPNILKWHWFPRQSFQWEVLKT